MAKLTLKTLIIAVFVLLVDALVQVYLSGAFSSPFLVLLLTSLALGSVYMAARALRKFAFQKFCLVDVILPLVLTSVHLGSHYLFGVVVFSGAPTAFLPQVLSMVVVVLSVLVMEMFP